MKIKALVGTVKIDLPSGMSLKVGTEPTEVHPSMEQEIRRALPHVFGVVEVDKPAKPAPVKPVEEVSTVANEKAGQ